MPRINFARNSYMDRSLKVNSQRLINLYPEQKPADSTAQIVLHGTPGLKLWGTAGTGPIRGMHELNGKLEVVSNVELYEMDTVPNATLKTGPFIKGSGRVSMESNGEYVMIVTNSANAYYTRTLTTPSLVAFQTGINWGYVTFQDGYHIMSTVADDAFYVSVYDGVASPFQAPAFDSTDFTLVNSLPDDLVAIKNTNREVWAFCEESTQIYYNSGQADFPFTRLPNGVLKTGCQSADSVAEIDATLFWLADDLTVRQSVGYRAQVISTPAIERAIAGYDKTNTATGFVYSQENHVFYVLTFPGVATWVYDATTQAWHERKSDGRDDWRVNTYVKFDGKHLVGDSVNGNIYELDLDTYTENGTNIIREAISPPLHAEGRWAFMSSFLLDMEGGVGLSTGQGSDPQAMMSFMDNGSHDWSSEMWASIGATGNDEARAFFNRLGRFRNRTIKVTISDPVKVAILDAFVEVEGGLR